MREEEEKEIRPGGLLTVIGARDRAERRGEFAIWATVIVRDGRGNEFEFEASAFAHSLKPTGVTPPIPT